MSMNQLIIPQESGLFNALSPLEFLSTLYGKRATGYLSIWHKQRQRTYWFAADGELRRAARTAQRLAQSGDVYFGVGLRRAPLGPKRRGRAEDVIALPSLFVDIDILDPVHTRTDLPPTLEAAQKLLDQFPLPPSIVLHSGHGLQAHWCLHALLACQTSDERAVA